MGLPATLPFPLPTDDVASASYVRQLKFLLPPGVAFDLEADSDVTATLTACAAELSRVDSRGDDVINESDPRTAEETIELWEKILGIPDAQIPVLPSTLTLRRLAVTAKYTARGGQNSAFFIALAAACGYTVTLARTAVLRVGFRVNDRCFGAAWAYSLSITVTAIAGDALSQDDFERVMQHATHAHITDVFSYP